MTDSTVYIEARQYFVNVSNFRRHEDKQDMRVISAWNKLKALAIFDTPAGRAASKFIGVDTGIGGSAA